MGSLKYIRETKHVQLLAFNKTIADELNARLNTLREELGRPFTNFKAATFHSLCFGAVRKHLASLGVRNPETDSRKLSKLCREFMTEPELELYASYVCKLVGYARGEGIGCLTPDLPDAWFSLIAHHDLMLDSEEATEDRAVELARMLLARSELAA